MKELADSITTAILIGAGIYLLRFTGDGMIGMLIIGTTLKAKLGITLWEALPKLKNKIFPTPQEGDEKIFKVAGNPLPMRYSLGRWVPK